MGRSRAVSRSTNDDSNQGRPKRKKPSSTTENIETAPPSSTGTEAANERKGGLYHCNYCDKDLSGVLHIKCAICPDYDLCVECFLVGAELNPHKCNHLYRVMDNLSFPFLCSDWNADEEILLLEGIETYGFGNWQEVADNVGTKTKSQCIDHYNSVYMNSPCFPLPDMSRVVGKSREELLAMAKECEVGKEGPAHVELSLKEELSSSVKIKHEASKKDPSHESSSGLGGGSDKTCPGTIKKFSTAQIKDEIKAEEQLGDRSIGEKKPRIAGHEGPSMTEFSGYNFKRQEFEIEYDNDAEQLLADMEFKDTDTDAERTLKLQVLHIYSKRLDERKRRKDFILDRNLLYPDPFEMSLTPEERQICKRYKVFMRFHSKEEHEELLNSIIKEHRILKRIQDLQEARAVGCRTAAEANRFIEEKRKKEAEENTQRLKEGAQTGVAGKALKSPRGLAKNLLPSGISSYSKIMGQNISSSLDNWDIDGLFASDLLSETEKRLCSEIRILPVHYLKMLETLSMEIMKGNIAKKSDAYSLFKVDPSKVDRIYDMLVKRGIAQT